MEDQQDSPAVVPALQALAGPLPQQLPPCDWSFLVELAKRDECCLLCVTIATAQAHWSPSAQAAADLMVKNICALGRTKVRFFLRQSLNYDCTLSRWSTAMYTLSIFEIL